LKVGAGAEIKSFGSATQEKIVEKLAALLSVNLCLPSITIRLLMGTHSDIRGDYIGLSLISKP
jgi:hypothetical protein